MELMLAAISGSSFVNAIIHLIIIGLIVWVLFWALGQIGLPEPFNKVVRVVLILLACVFVINFLLSLTGNQLITW